MLNKKAQIKMIETVAILVVFFILLGAGLFFYFNYQKSSITKETDTLIQSDIIKKGISLLTLPEISCTLAQSDVTKGCIDYYKAKHVKKYVVDLNQEYYFDVLQFSTVRLEIIYPSADAQNITIYNKTKSNFTQKTSVPLPVSVFKPYPRIGSDGKVEQISSYVYGILYLDIYN